MNETVSRPRKRWLGKALYLLAALTIATVTIVLDAGPAAAAESCGTPSSSGGYTVTACSGDAADGSTYGFLYISLPAGHAPCTIHGKVIFEDNPPNGYAQDWTCPSGAISNVRYDIDYAANGYTFTRGEIRTSSGTTIVTADSDS